MLAVNCGEASYSTIRRLTQISTRPRATKQGCIKCMSLYRSSGPNTGRNPGGGRILKNKKTYFFFSPQMQLLESMLFQCWTPPLWLPLSLGQFSLFWQAWLPTPCIHAEEGSNSIMNNRPFDKKRIKVRVPNNKHWSSALQEAGPSDRNWTTE